MAPFGLCIPPGTATATSWARTRVRASRRGSMPTAWQRSALARYPDAAPHSRDTLSEGVPDAELVLHLPAGRPRAQPAIAHGARGWLLGRARPHDREAEPISVSKDGKPLWGPAQMHRLYAACRTDLERDPWQVPAALERLRAREQ